MKFIFAFMLLLLAACSVGAWLWVPNIAGGRTVLYWVTDDAPIRREQIAAFNGVNPEYHVVIDPQPMGMEKTIVQGLAGVGPDIFDCYNGFQLAGFVRSGIALDVTDELLEVGAAADDYWSCALPSFMLDGRLYGHPGNASSPGLWFNKKIFDEAGEPYPSAEWTWEECLAAAERLTLRDDRGRPTRFGLILDKFDWRSVFLPQWGGRFYSPEGTRCILDSSEAQAGMQYFQDILLKRRVAPNLTDEMAFSSAGGWGVYSMSLFASGRGAMAIGGRWWLIILRNPVYQDALEIGAVPVPHGPTDVVYGQGRSTLVNRNSKHLEGALAFVEFMRGPEWNMLVNDRADGLASVKDYLYAPYEEGFINNAEHPEEDFHLMWRVSMEHAIPEIPSPFVNGQAVDRVLLKHTDLMRAGGETGAEAMVDAAAEINALIVERLKIDPPLRERYLQLVAQGAPPAWDAGADSP
jgi:multiple sugar transport system substrate-binding protein